jgi:hypothetical protein
LFRNENRTALSLLAYKDSNLNSQNQNLMCYRYTIGQTYCLFSKASQRYNVFVILKSSALKIFSQETTSSYVSLFFKRLHYLWKVLF